MSETQSPRPREELGGMSAEQWATYADAATLVGVPESTVRTWKQRGVISWTTIGKTLHVHLADVRRAERSMRLHGHRPGHRRGDLLQVRDIPTPR